MKYLCVYLILMLPIYAEEKVRITSLEWPPFSSKNLQDYGVVLKKIDEVFKTVNISSSFYFFPWVRSVKVAESGEFDGIAPEYYSKEREENFFFSDSIMTSPLVLVSKNNFQLKTLKDIKEIYPFKIGLVRGYVNTPAIDHYKNIKKDLATDDLSNIKKLIAGRVELIAIDLNVFNYLRTTHNITENLHILSPILEEKNLYLLFPKSQKGSSELRDRFNKGLKIMNANALSAPP